MFLHASLVEFQKENIRHLLIFTLVLCMQLPQNTVNATAFCSGVTKHCKYQPFGLYPKTIIVNSNVAVAIKKIEIGPGLLLF